jgi:hypothetical protein
LGFNHNAIKQNNDNNNNPNNDINTRCIYKYIKMDLDQSTTTSIVSFFMKVTAAVSMVFLSKLYKIVSCIEEDKNQKYYVTYYKISELENYIEALQHDVTHMKETCVLLQDKLAAQKELLEHGYHLVPQEDDAVISGAITNEPVESELDDVSGLEVSNGMENNEVELDRILTSIKEETINPDYIEEKNRANTEEYEHVVKTGPIDPAQKYKLWKGFF